MKLGNIFRVFALSFSAIVMTAQANGNTLFESASNANTTVTFSVADKNLSYSALKSIFGNNTESIDIYNQLIAEGVSFDSITQHLKPSLSSEDLGVAFIASCTITGTAGGLTISVTADTCAAALAEFTATARAIQRQ